MHNSTNTDIYLTTADAKSPIIEGCTHIRFLRTSVDDENTLAAAPTAATAQDTQTPTLIDVQDFSHVMKPSPNWTYIPHEARAGGTAWLNELRAKFGDNSEESPIASILDGFLPQSA
jgi:hypothetical protein